MAVGYVLHCSSDPTVFGQCNLQSLAHKVFGEERVRSALQQVQSELLRWGYGTYRATVYVARVVYTALLMNRSPYLEDLSREVLETLHQGNIPDYLKREVVLTSRVLTALAIIDQPLAPAPNTDEPALDHHTSGDCLSVWSEWSRRWRNTSTLAPRTRKGNYYKLLQVGRWLAKAHPEVTTPEKWTRELAAEYVAVVDRTTSGQWAETSRMPTAMVGKPISAHTKNGQLTALRTFFRDCQEWGWIPRLFDPRRCFSTPRSIRALIAPDPRIIADDVWAKLLWSGLNLTQDDLPAHVYGKGSSRCESYYPLKMIRAMVIVWLFAGLRSDELRRLRVGCVRWQREDARVPGTGEMLAKDAICWLDVPAHKTGTAFTKAVDSLVGEAIAEWEQVRPSQPVAVDRKTGEAVHYLFSYRARQIGPEYLNASLIPLLCRKGGIPERDARGSITSHRARSTIASQLYNAKEPLSLYDLQAWLGHRLISSTQHYAKKSPTKVAKAYEKAGYFGRNLRTIEVLIDQDVIKSGAAANGTPWKFYDLGHGYCTYEFFDQCPHRMACAKCAFYRPKGSSQAQLLEGKANLQLMLQEIPLGEDERAAVEDGIAAMEKLCQRLADVPTPAGPTPNQLATGDGGMQTMIPIERIERARKRG
jgi:integrase